MKELVVVIAVLALVVSGIGISAQAKRINHLESRIAVVEENLNRFQEMWEIQVTMNQLVYDYYIAPATAAKEQTELTRNDKMILGLASIYLAPQPKIVVETEPGVNHRRYIDYPR